MFKEYRLSNGINLAYYFSKVYTEYIILFNNDNAIDNFASFVGDWITKIFDSTTMYHFGLKTEREKYFTHQYAI